MLTFLGPNSLSHTAATHAACTAKCHSASATSIVALMTLQVTRVSPSIWKRFGMQQSWQHSVFSLNGTKATRIIHVCGLVLTETYVLRIHVSGPDGFQALYDRNPQMHILSLPIYKGGEPPDRHIITSLSHLKEAGYFPKQVVSRSV